MAIELGCQTTIPVLTGGGVGKVAGKLQCRDRLGLAIYRRFARCQNRPCFWKRACYFGIAVYVPHGTKEKARLNMNEPIVDRITIRQDQMGGVPCIRGLRIPVATVVGMVADGMTNAEILAAYPDLEPEDIRVSLRFAAEALQERELPLVSLS